jgi:hypothetical protein
MLDSLFLTQKPVFKAAGIDVAPAQAGGGFTFALKHTIGISIANSDPERRA